MKFLTKRKDGGPQSTVTGYWLVEIKWLFSIVLLRFDGRSRNAFHTHAFNCISWVLKGGLFEEFRSGGARFHFPAWLPFVTRRSDFHKVESTYSTSWVLSIRGPWSREWREYLPDTSEHLTLPDGRQIVRREPQEIPDMPKIDINKPLQLVDGTPVVFSGIEEYGDIVVNAAGGGKLRGRRGRCFLPDGTHRYKELPNLQNVPEAVQSSKKVAPKLTPLAKKVLKYLQRKGNASSTEAFLDLDQLNSGSFTRRITELREAGYPITDEWRLHPITGRQYKRYFYALHS